MFNPLGSLIVRVVFLFCVACGTWSSTPDWWYGLLYLDMLFGHMGR